MACPMLPSLTFDSAMNVAPSATRIATMELRRDSAAAARSTASVTVSSRSPMVPRLAKKRLRPARCDLGHGDPDELDKRVQRRFGEALDVAMRSVVVGVGLGHRRPDAVA